MNKQLKTKSGKPKVTKPESSAKSQLKRKTRQDQLKTLLSRKNGATVARIQTVFDWQPHSVRAAVSGLRKAGENIEKVQTVSVIAFRIVAAGADK